MSKRALTWIKPTAEQLHLWNYFWAVRPMINFQDQWYELFALVVDLHATTTLHDTTNLKRNIINVLKSYIACGLDPDKALIYKQSDIPAHTQLAWVLSCITNIWFMKRMHAFKDAVQKWGWENVSMGTFNYPILMASDILLYDPDIVPVGKDQKQHAEFARDIAQKFNSMFGHTFKLPEPFIKKEVATVPWIDGRKMSKSYNNFIGLFDDDNTILKKCKSVVTDNIPVEEPKDPDKCNVYNILKLFLSEQEDKNIRNKYKEWWLKFSEVKILLYEKVIEFVKPIQKKMFAISDDQVVGIIKKWSEKASFYAEKKIKEVYDKVWYNV